METEPLLKQTPSELDYEIAPLLPETADNLRSRERMDTNYNSTASPNKRTFMRCGGLFLVAIIVAGICLAVFLPGPISEELDKPSIFGGMFSIAEDESYNVVNHYTQDTSCPDGYSEHAVAHFVACYHCGAVELYLCLHNDVHKDPQGFFGGMFNTNECETRQYANPLTNTYGCNGEEGYMPYLAIASQTEHFCDTNVFVCLKGDLQDDVLLGGIYTEFVTYNGCGECSAGNVNNAMIDSLECPENYRKRLIAYAYSPGSMEDCPGCNGRAYACLMRVINEEESDTETEAQSDVSLA